MGIKLGLAGLGSFGSVFAKLFAAHPLVDRLSLCDCEKSKIQNQLNDPFMNAKVNPKDCYGTLEELCKTDVDAIAIITQPWLHAPQCIQAMEAGKHVYSAVPIISLPDFDEILDWCSRILDAQKRTGKYYMLGETTVYRPLTMFCSRMAAEGRFGEFVYAEGEYVHDLDSSCNLRQVRKHRTTGIIGEQYNAFMKKYHDKGIKGSPMSYPTHSISGPIHVMKTRAVSVSALGTLNTNNDDFFADSLFSNITALYRLENGASMRVCEFREIGSGAMDRIEPETFRIIGKSGSFSANVWEENHRTVQGTATKLESTQLTEEAMRDPLPPEVALAYKAALMPNATPEDDFVPSGHGGSHPYLVNEFVTSVAEGRESAIPASEATHYMAMGAAAHKSAAKDGEIVKVQKLD